jgi:hypothetical protein
MKKTISFPLFLSLCCLHGQVYAHTRYIVEAPAPTYVVVQPQAPVTYVEVESAPPADVDEEMGSSPGAEYLWIKGNWQWEGSRWVRVRGRWAARPHAAAVWMPGCWCERHHHWHWTEGYWR